MIDVSVIGGYLMDEATQKKDLDRIIGLAKHIRDNEKPNAFIEMVNEYDFYQYYLMRDNGMIEFNYTVADNVYYFLTQVNLTNKGHEFIDTLDDEDDYENIRKLASKQGKKLVELPLDLTMKLSIKYLESKFGL